MNYQRELIEKYANRVLEINNQSLPIDIELLAKNYSDVRYVEFPPKYSKIDGLCYKNGGNSAIIINLEIPENRKRFTLSHELGHLMLPHHQGFISCNAADAGFHFSYIDISKQEQGKVIEREADIFAAELLMPKKWVAEVIKENLSIRFENILRIITSFAKVSVEAACISIIDKMPINHAVIICDSYSHQFKDTYKGYFSSYDNYIDIGSSKHPLTEIRNLCKKAFKFEEFSLDNYKLYYFNFNFEYEPSNYKVADIDDPNELLMKICKDLYGLEYLKFNRFVNGLVGAINSNSEKVKMTEAQFNRRLIDKIKTRSEFSDAPNHEYFDDFLAKKYRKIFRK